MSKLPNSLIKVGLGIIIVGLLGWVAWSRFSPGKQEEEIVRVNRGEIVQSVRETGKVSSAKTLELAFNSTGKIENFFVREGEVVEAGKILAIMDQSELAREKERQEAAVFVAQTNVRNAEDSLKNVTEKVKIDLENQYATTFSTILSSVTKGDAALRNEKIIFDKYFLSFADQTVLKIKESYEIATNAFSKTNQGAETMRTLNSPSSIESALSSIRESLIKISTSLEAISSALGDPLYKTTSADRDTIDTHRNAISAELSNITSASNNLASLKISNQIKIDDANAAIRANQASLKEAQASLALTIQKIEKTKLIAPISGTVTKIDAEVGEVAQPGKLIIFMRGLEPFEIEVEIPEADISKVKIGSPVSIIIEAIDKEKKLKGNISKIDPQEIISDSDIYYKATIAFSEELKGIRQGMAADLEIEVSRVPDALLIPRRALIRSADGVKVKVKTPGRPEERKITLGIEDEKNAQILRGLVEGEEVIIQRKTSR